MVNYPTKKTLTNTSSAFKASNARGMNLEKDINDSNTFYREIDRAIIYKKPTPVQITKVDYPNRKSAKIAEGFYKIPSTTDYNGIYRGKYIDFEAKETKSKTSFTLRNIHPHQITHLKQIVSHGGIAFVIIRFTSYNETYLLDANIMIQAYEEQSKKSISYQTIKELGHFIQESLSPRLKYLDVVDDIYF